MSKHKKTLRQKIIADYRRNLYSLENKYISSPKNINPTTALNDTQTYSYVLHDISKTLILTLVLVGLQILLFFLFKNHLIKLPNINY